MGLINLYLDHKVYMAPSIITNRPAWSGGSLGIIPYCITGV